jgi:hypothetical protein
MPLDRRAVGDGYSGALKVLSPDIRGVSSLPRVVVVKRTNLK